MVFLFFLKIMLNYITETLNNISIIEMAAVTKIEHMVKLHVFGNNSKTINNIRYLRGKNDQHSKI